MVPSAPTFELTFGADGTVVATGQGEPFCRQSGFEVAGDRIEKEFSSHFSPELADLVDVAMAVYTADRVCPRPARSNRYDHHWHRSLSLRVPVRNPELWQDRELLLKLGDVLAFMTDDDWEFEFCERVGVHRHVQGFLFRSRPPAPVRAALFSGGLDSLAGLASELMVKREDTFVLFCGWTNGRVAGLQRRLVSSIAERSSQRLVPVLVRFGIRREGADYNDDERTQRTRGFVHSVLGAAVALSAGSDALACYENGVGALNLPMTPAQLGAQNTRSAHPVALTEIAELIELATGKNFRIELPFLYHTKAAMCRAIEEAGLGDLIRDTVSCDSFPRRVAGPDGCGTCTSCLLRRQALKAAGLSHRDPADSYSVDVMTLTAVGDDVVYDFRAMLEQAHTIRSAVSSGEPWQSLCRSFPELEHAVLHLERKGWDAEHLRVGLLELFRSYCQEWERFRQRELPLVLSPPSRS